MSDRQSDLFQLGIRRWALGAERWPTLANADRPKRPRAQTRPAIKYVLKYVALAPYSAQHIF